MHVSKSVKDGHTVYRRINPKALCLFKVGGIIIKAILKKKKAAQYIQSSLEKLSLSITPMAKLL